MIFTVPGTPHPWQRARISRSGRMFTDAKTKAYKEKIALYARQAGVELLEGPVRITMICYWPSRKPDLKKNPRDIEWMDKRPDIDNILKVYLDALQGIAFTDDRQIVNVDARKFRARQGDDARVQISIHQILTGS